MAKAATALKKRTEEADAPKSRQEQKPQGQQMCKVYDIGATEKKRIHHVEGQRYELSAYEEEGCTMPLTHGLHFLKDKQFAVYTMDGTRMRPQTTVSDGRGLKLAPHETIATYAELTKEALVRRAQSLPNGLLNNLQTPREKLIAFIMAGGIQATLVEDTDKKAGKDAGIEAEMEEDGDQAFADRILSQNAPGSTGPIAEAPGAGDADLGSED